MRPPSADWSQLLAAQTFSAILRLIHSLRFALTMWVVLPGTYIESFPQEMRFFLGTAYCTLPKFQTLFPHWTTFEMLTDGLLGVQLKGPS